MTVDGDTAAGSARIRRGALCMLTAALLYAIFDSLAKSLVVDYHAVQVVFFRALFGLLPWLFLARGVGYRVALRTAQPLVQILRGALSFAALLCYVLAYATLPLAEAVSIAYSAPLFMTVIAIPLLREQVGARRWAALLVGFGGVLVLVRPGPELFSGGALWAVAGALLYATSAVVTRMLGARNLSVTTMFYSMTTSLVLGGLSMLALWVTPNASDLLRFAALGLVAGIAQYLLVQAYKLAPVAVVSPLEYTTMAWAVVSGIVIWGEVPDWITFAGIAIVLGSGLYILRREGRTGPDDRPLPRLRFRA